jgi:hypothetical protein
MKDRPLVLISFWTKSACCTSRVSIARSVIYISESVTAPELDRVHQFIPLENFKDCESRQTDKSQISKPKFQPDS